MQKKKRFDSSYKNIYLIRSNTIAQQYERNIIADIKYMKIIAYIYYFVFLSSEDKLFLGFFQLKILLFQKAELKFMQLLMESTVNHCYYAIEMLKSRFISIRIQNFDTKKLMRVLIDNSMLQQCETTVNQLYQLMYKQWIYQSKINKKMIKYEKGVIYITINFPNAHVRIHEFSCEEINLNDAQLALEMIDRFTNQRLKAIQMIAKQAEDNISELFNKKLNNWLKCLQENKQQTDLKISNLFAEKMQAFQMFINRMQPEYERKYEKLQQQAMIKVSQHNLRLNNELNVTVSSLEQQIETLNNNLRQVYNRNQDIQALIEQQTDKYNKISQKLISVEEKFEAIINSLLQSLSSKLNNRSDVLTFRKTRIKQNDIQHIQHNQAMLVSQQMLDSQSSLTNEYLFQSQKRIEHGSATKFIYEDSQEKNDYQQLFLRRKNTL